MTLNILQHNTDTITTKERNLLWLIAFFFMTFYLPDTPVINNIVIFALGVFCIFFNTRTEKKHLLKQRPAIYFIIAFYVWQIISAFTSDNLAMGMRLLEVRIPLLFFPLTLGLIYITRTVKLRIFLIYAMITTLAALICSIASFVVYIKTGDAGFLYNDSLSNIIGKQSVYFALMVNIAILVYGYLLTQDAIRPSFQKWVYVAMAFLLIIHFMLASRMEIVFLYSCGIVFAMYYFFVKKKDQKMGIIMIGGLVFCSGIFVTLFPKTVNRFDELQYSKFSYQNEAVESHYNMKLTPDQWNGFNIRLAIWNCGLEVIGENPVTGVSLGDKDQELLDKFEEKQFEFGIRTNKNMHSTYLDMLSGMGIIGLLTFLLGYLILPMLKSLKVHDVIGLLVLTDFTLSFVTETYPDRSMGCIIFGFFVSFLISYKGNLPGKKSESMLS